MIYYCLEEQRSIIYGKEMTKKQKQDVSFKKNKKSWPVKPNQC